MKLSEHITEGLISLKYRKLRSFLAILGIVFGIASVVSMYAVGEGARKQILNQLNQLGVNNIIVSGIEKNLIPEEDLEKYNKGLLVEDFIEIKELPAIKDFAYRITVTSGGNEKIEVFSMARKLNIPVELISQNYFKIMDINAGKGRLFTSIDYSDMLFVCVLGSNAKEKIAPLKNIVGESAYTLDSGYKIVGVLSKTAKSSMKVKDIEFNDFDNTLFIPYPTFVKRKNFQYNYIDEAIIQVNDTKNIFAAASYIQKVLERKHKGVKDFKIFIPQKIINQSTQTQRIFNIVMGVISGISLLIGGIGVMNIMLANILERTKEIGIRRAVGAKKEDILMQFLIESVIICGVGGFLGLLFGIAGSYAVSFYTGWKIVISFKTMFLAFLVSSFIGVVSGIYPAFEASGQNPIKALHYE